MRSSLIWYFVLASPNTYLLHQELLNFMLIAMSTQLLSGPKPGQNDVHPFLGAAMDQVTMRNDPIFNMNLVYCCCWLDRSCYIYIYIYMQESSLVGTVVRKLLLNYMMRPKFSNGVPYTIYSEGNQPGVLQRVGSAAGMLTWIQLIWIFFFPYFSPYEMIALQIASISQCASLWFGEWYINWLSTWEHQMCIELALKMWNICNRFYLELFKWT